VIAVGVGVGVGSGAVGCDSLSQAFCIHTMMDNGTPSSSVAVQNGVGVVLSAFAFPANHNERSTETNSRFGVVVWQVDGS
jgi:hypothetical protein